MRNDQDIFEDVTEKLKFNPRIRSSDIAVLVKNGIVTLRGTIGSYIEKVYAEAATKQVRDVKGVVVDLKVVLPSEKSRTDPEIAKAAVHSLEWDVTVPDKNIQIVVENGIITLTGEVPLQFQRERAEKIVHGLIGVKNVINNILIKPSISPREVKDKIKREFERNARIEAGNINVEVSGGKVILKGKVRSWDEHEEAESVSWSIPGITIVENLIRIE